MTESGAVNFRGDHGREFPGTSPSQHASFKDGLQFLVPREGSNVICKEGKDASLEMHRKD